MPIIPDTFSEEGRFERNPNDFYETPYLCAKAFLAAPSRTFRKEDNVRILDPGCGTGVWGRAARERWPNATIHGVDIVKPFYDAQWNVYDKVWLDDYLTWEAPLKYDLIIGNPPYSSASNRNLAMNFVQKSLSLIAPYGQIEFLLKTEFLASNTRFTELFKQHRPTEIFQSVDRISWNGSGRGNTIEYAFFVWRTSNLDRTEMFWVKWKNVEEPEVV